MKNKFIFVKFILIFLIFSSKTFAFSSDPKEFISELVNEAKIILVKENSKELKAKKLSELALKVVDIKGIGLYTLGNYRKEINSDQMAKYLKLFEGYFLKSFSSRLSDYSDPRIDVLSAKVINENYTIVESILLATEQRPEVKINWRVYTKNKKKPVIRDLMIEGLSLARTQKEEFASIIQNNDNDISELFIKLQEFTNQ